MSENLSPKKSPQALGRLGYNSMQQPAQKAWSPPRLLSSLPTKVRASTLQALQLLPLELSIPSMHLLPPATASNQWPCSWVPLVAPNSRDHGSDNCLSASSLSQEVSVPPTVAHHRHCEQLSHTFIRRVQLEMICIAMTFPPFLRVQNEEKITRVVSVFDFWRGRGGCLVILCLVCVQ